MRDQKCYYALHFCSLMLAEIVNLGYNFIKLYPVSRLCLLMVELFYSQVFLWRRKSYMLLSLLLATWTYLQTLFHYTILQWSWFSWEALCQLCGTWGITKLFADLMTKIKILFGMFSLWFLAWYWLLLYMRSLPSRRY